MKILLLLISISLGLFSPIAQAADIDVFVGMGQSNGDDPNLWTAFTWTYRQETQQSVEVINCTVGASALVKQYADTYDVTNNNWDVNGARVPDCFLRVDAQMAAWVGSGNTPVVKGVIWIGEESDAAVLSGGEPPYDMAPSTNARQALLDRTQVKWPTSKFFIVRLGQMAFEYAPQAYQATAALRTNQETFATNNPTKVKIVARGTANYPFTYPLGSSGPATCMADAFHYPACRRDLGTAVGAVVAEKLREMQ